LLIMPLREVSYIDAKGRVLIPSSMRDVLNMKDGEKVVLELDSSGRTVKIEPAYEKKLLVLNILLGDRPGTLASAATVLADLGVDLVSTQSHSTRRGTAAVWEVECNPEKASMREIREGLAKAGAKLISSKWI
jgi:AbrB family looped-hinge helix DNA binding protein